MPAPSSILERVELFARNLESYLAPDYKETQLRREFLDPFFEALGWDVQTRESCPEFEDAPIGCCARRCLNT